MKIRELLVAIKVSVEDAGAKKLAAALDGIVKMAPKVGTSLAATERAAAKAAREQERAANLIIKAKAREEKAAKQTARESERADKAKASEATKAAREVERAEARASGSRRKAATEAERAAARIIAVEKKKAREIERESKAQERAIERVKRAADRAEREATRNTAERRTARSENLGEMGGGMKSAAGSLATGAGMFVGALAAGGGFALQTAAEFESLREQLKNILGDSAKAETAFAGIKNFAATTPFQLKEVTEAFVALKVRGVEPTDAKLTALGDLSSTFGHTIGDMTEAIAAAARGELDPIEKFGISGKIAGDKIALSFKGQKVEIDRSADAVTNALVAFGQMDGVAGAMAGQMNTLNGKWSNFKDAVANAVDQAMTSSGALEEAKGLLADLTGGADGAAMAFGTVLADGLKAAREWLSKLTAEDIQAWLDQAVKAGMAMIDMIGGAVEAIMGLIDVATTLSEAMGLSDQTVTTLTLAFGALALAGGGLPGVFAAVAVAAASMGSAIGMAIGGASAEMIQLQSLASETQHLIAMMEIQGRIDKSQAGINEALTIAGLVARGLTYEEARSQSARGQVAKIDFKRDRADAQFDAIAKANREGFGEEFFATAAEQGSRMETSGRATNATDAQKALAGAGANAGLSDKAARARGRLAAAKAAEIERIRKSGGDVASREAGIKANETKARKAFTDATRKGQTEDQALAAAERALLDQGKPKGGGRGGGKAKKDPAQQDILEQLGLKGPGSILENRPSPQSLVISTVVTIKAADSIAVTIAMPPGTTMAGVGEVAGKQVGEDIAASISANLAPVIESVLALRMEELGKMMGAGRVPRTAKKGTG